MAGKLRMVALVPMVGARMINVSERGQITRKLMLGGPAFEYRTLSEPFSFELFGCVQGLDDFETIPVEVRAVKSDGSAPVTIWHSSETDNGHGAVTFCPEVELNPPHQRTYSLELWSGGELLGSVSMFWSGT